ncbi:hypothetical protein ACFCX0_03545 [Streptomyces sp. NPDC056352]|uniref:hypothetical protein n=1 Tax=Streptomyces sp. NPDC056352 TaxID=3345791 RepID=UPI0035DBB5D2
MPYPKTVRATKVTSDRVDLTVSTIQLGFRCYETVIFDDHDDERHAGMRLGDYVIGKSQKTFATRDEAMDDHREALYEARTGQPR